MPPHAHSQSPFGDIPFETFGAGKSSAAVDTTKLYETLEVPKDADIKDIKRAYYKLSRKHHPDKGGDEHVFKEINAAYEILGDPDMRARYDKYGLEGVSDDGRAPGGGGEDLFSMFFGRNAQRRTRPSKGPDVNHPLNVTLEDLYNGKTKKMAVNRKVIDGDVNNCEMCDGLGTKMEIKELAPGMVTQVQQPCFVCQGQGSTFKTKTERKVVEVHIAPGTKHNQKVNFRGIADEFPNMETGDVNFIIQEKQHELFNRKGADLVVFKDISLNQALCGFSLKIKHLDGREIVIKTRPGEVIKGGTKDASGETIPYFKMVEGEGMPSLGNPFVKGNLYINFHIRFPEDGELSEEVIETLKQTLPDPDEPEDYDPMDVEEVNMVDADLRNFGHGGAAMSGYDSDNETSQRPVQCQQS